jgi:hypothetical protein
MRHGTRQTLVATNQKTKEEEMQRTSINLGSLSNDEILAGKTGNPSAESEI